MSKVCEVHRSGCVFENIVKTKTIVYIKKIDKKKLWWKFGALDVGSHKWTSI